MKVRWLTTEDTPLRYVPDGTVAEVDGELAKRLIAEGIAVPVEQRAEKAVPEKGRAAVRK